MGMDETKQSEQKKKLMFATVWRFTPEYFRSLYPEHTHAAKILHTNKLLGISNNKQENNGYPGYRVC